MKLNKLIAALAVTVALTSCAQERTLHIVTTGDVHGSWFSMPYVEGGRTKTSLMSVKAWVDSLRQAEGKGNVLLLDAGDCLQGDNAAYYYNYIAKDEPHLFPKIAAYMSYDAIAVGNHDIETGHGVYDKVAAESADLGIPWLAGNYTRSSDGHDYFPAYRTFRRAGMKVLVMGFGNANIKGWLAEDLWSGIEFESLATCVQRRVDEAIAAEKPDAVVVLVHSGTGLGDGSMLENQGLDLLNSLSGVDVLVTSHDHRPCVIRNEQSGCVLINGGARAANVGHATISLAGGKKVTGETVRMDKDKVDEAMAEKFSAEFGKVRDFTNQEVGSLAMELRTRDAYTGMCDYLNLVHTVQIGVPEADIAFSAPLTFNGSVSKGRLIFNDMFTIYPFENTMSVIRMTGDEIARYIEFSYDTWIQTPGEHLLKIQQEADPRTGARKWSFVNRSYNFDSASGIVYTVDVTRPYGQRVKISSMADGSPFLHDRWYNVAMTSYRANGGGGLLAAVGIDSAEMLRRVVAEYPEIREMIYRFIGEHNTITPELIGDPAVIGSWRFVPESVAEPLLKKDMALIF